MENLIQLQQGAKAYGSRELFDQASFAINEGEHVGVIGPNGAGKTTLFRVLIGEEPLDTGIVIKSRGLKLGYLSQHDSWLKGETIEGFLERGTTLPIWELKSLGRALGLTEEHYTREVSSLSGGYRMRAKLLHLIGQEPNLMLLDEPTNYLDLETLMVLEKFLQSYEGAFLLISHDREFLRRTTDHTLEVEGGAITKYNGNIDDYFEQKELLRQQMEARAMSVEEKRKQILDFVARFGAKATKASQAQSRLKSLDRLESIELKPLPVTARIRIPPPARTGKIILKISGVDLGYPSKRVLSGIELQLAAGDHLAVVGLNGAGKTTLLKSLAGKLEPLRGKIELGYEVTLAYFAQHVAEDLDPDRTVLQELNRKAHVSVLPQEVLDLAGSLLFSGDDVHKPVRILSGGERSRVALGQVLLQRASCLILDEPTNHLDFQTVEALTQSLHAFPGSLIIVSHDRGFIRRIGTKILEVESGHVSTYPGSYDEYVWSLERGAYATLRGPTSAKSAPSRGNSADKTDGNKFNYKEQKKTLDRRLKQLETQISEIDSRVEKGQSKLAELNHQISSTPLTEAGPVIQEMGQIQTDMDALEERWLQSVEERDQVLAKLRELTES